MSCLFIRVSKLGHAPLLTLFCCTSPSFATGCLPTSAFFVFDSHHSSGLFPLGFCWLLRRLFPSSLQVLGNLGAAHPHAPEPPILDTIENSIHFVALQTFCSHLSLIFGV